MTLFLTFSEPFLTMFCLFPIKNLVPCLFQTSLSSHHNTSTVYIISNNQKPANHSTFHPYIRLLGPYQNWRRRSRERPLYPLKQLYKQQTRCVTADGCSNVIVIFMILFTPKRFFLTPEEILKALKSSSKCRIIP